MSDTILAAIISGVFSLVIGLISGYNICLRVNEKQKNIQKARDNVNQIQIGEINEK